MQGRFSRITSRISSVISGVVSGGKAVAGVIKRAWNSEVVQETFPTFLSQAWSGVSVRNLAAPVEIYQNYPQAREALISYGVENILLNPAFLVWSEQLLTRYLRTLPGIQGSYIAYGLDVVDMAAYVYLLRQSLNVNVNNIFYRTALAKAATPLPIPEKDRDKPEHFHEFEPCPSKCGDTASTMADFMSIFESSADTVFCYGTAFAISTLLFSMEKPLPFIGGIVLYPLLSLKYGRDILNVKLSSVGMCETHRQEILDANNGYCLGKGASLLSSIAALRWGISYFSGEGSSLLYSGLFHLGYTSFMLAELQIDKKILSGQKPGINVFGHMHRATEAGVKWTISTAVAMCYDPKSKVTWADQMKWWSDTYHSAPLSWIMKLCFGSDTLFLNEFLERPAVKSCVKVYERTVKDNVKWVNDLRTSRLIHYVLKASPVLPMRVISKETEGVLLSLRSKEMDGPAQLVDNLIYKIYPGKFPYIPLDGPEFESLRAKQLVALSSNEKAEEVSEKVSEKKAPETIVVSSVSMFPPVKKESRLLMKEEGAVKPSKDEKRLLIGKYHND